MKDFDDNGILQDFILIGSWVLRVYAEHFADPQIPILATQDLEFFLLDQGKKEDFIFYFHDMPGGWRKDLLPILKANDSELFDILKDVS
ncbi:MAG: hypothetical protein JXR86_11765 [Spirochaetales bacterium]|nr:hypothetical protein [Spirochaetales bacterium]